MTRKNILIKGGRVLRPGGLDAIDIEVRPGPDGSRIALAPMAGDITLDATGLLVLPGLVDVHGDAFERQIMPRPGVSFALDTALLETDRQLAANGITTAFHGVTRSWEPGLRDAAHARGLLERLELLQPHLATDTRFHLRHETFNLEGEGEIIDWLADRRVGVIAFNDHMTGTIKVRHRPDKMAKMVERSGLDAKAFDALVERVAARASEVPASISRLAAAAKAAGVPAMSHDDMDIAQRRWFASLGVDVAEFPLTDEVAEAAAGDGVPIVFGAPNVVRGGSHTGCPDAADMVRRGWCSVLASDYYYPSLLQAPFILRQTWGVGLETAWALVSRNAAGAVGLADRGSIEEGLRADLVLVEVAQERPAKAVATITDGRLVHLADGSRLGG
ncbi:MAG: alpha-D-ribose 1-methylphosphonate 5-triphosphate diphosphatase [Hyphomicrobiaceae bacterium]